MDKTGARGASNRGSIPLGGTSAIAKIKNQISKIKNTD